MTIHHPLRRLACVAAMAMGIEPAAAAWSLDVDATVFHDDNLTRAQKAVDRRADRALGGGASVRNDFVVSGYDVWVVSADLRAEGYDRYPGLDYVALGASVRYRRKLGLGLQAPYLAFDASAAYADYRVDVRDGTKVRLNAELGKRFDESLGVTVGLGHDRRYARSDVPLVPGISGAIFELEGNSAHANVDYALDERWLASGRASARRGDVESTAQRSRAIFVASTAIAADPAFRDPSLIGYRLRGTTLSASLALSYALHDRASLSVGCLYEHTRAAEGLEYRSRVVDASLAYRF